MSQPPVYQRQYNFTAFQTTQPTATLPANEVDVEYNAIKVTLDAVLANLALLQNADGTVANASIGLNQLSTAITAGFTAPVAWVTGTAYSASPASTVFQGTGFYTCLISHTSGVFATDLAALKWVKVMDLSTIVLGSGVNIAFTPPAGMISTNVDAAIKEVFASSARTSHTHPSSAISDSTADGRAFLTATLAAQKTLLGLGSLAFLNSLTITTLPANLSLTGKQTPVALSGNTNDYTTTGWTTSTIVELSASTPINITGLTATTDGDIKILDNVGTNNITFTSNDASSGAANRLLIPRPLPLRPGQSAVWKYDGANTGWRYASAIPTNPPAGTYKNLLCGNAGSRNFTAPTTPATQYVITADELVLEDPNGETWQVKNVNLTNTTGTVGAGAQESAFSLVSASLFYWVIGNPTTNTVQSLCSVSATAPTMPSGYTFKMRVGAAFTTAASVLFRTFQEGRRIQCVLNGVSPAAVYQILLAGGTGTLTTTTFTGTAVSVVGIVPSTASRISVVFTNGNGGGVTAVSPSNNFAGYASQTVPVPFVNTATAIMTAEFALESSNIFVASTQGNAAFFLYGWEDNI